MNKVKQELRVILSTALKTVPQHVVSGLSKGASVQIEACQSKLLDRIATMVLRRFDVVMERPGGEYARSRD